MEKKSFVCVHHGCPFCEGMSLPASLHNIQHMFEPHRMVKVVHADFHPPLTRRIENVFGELMCPVGFLRDTAFNYLRTMNHIYFYFKKFFD